MKKKFFPWIFILILILLLSGCTVYGPDASVPEPPKGDASPVVFETIDLEGNVITSSLFTGSKLTMVNVWATYCGPCLNEMPELGELAGEYATEDFQLIGVISDVASNASQEDLDYAASLVQQTNANYPHLLLNESIYNAMLTGVTAVPTTFFFDETGTSLGFIVGAKEKNAWKEIIDGLLEK